MARRVVLALTAMILLLVLAGCTGRSVIITWTPNPVIMKPGDQTIEGKVNVRTTGLLSPLEVGVVTVEALDKDGDVVKSKVFNINRTLPMFTNVNVTEDVELDISYQQIVSNNVAKIRVSVTGSDPGVIEVEIKTE